MGNSKSIDGVRFGKLIAVRKVGSDRHGTIWECQCDCGGLAVIPRYGLVRGDRKSCGCMRGHNLRTHGLSGTRTYRIWAGMKNRCTNPNNRCYQAYGGAGVTVCDAWMRYEGFVADMGECPEGMELDRIDSSSRYSPDNCRWVNRVLQSRNRKYAKIGEDGAAAARGMRDSGMTYTEIAKTLGCARSSVTSAINGKTYSKKAVEVSRGSIPAQKGS